MRCLFVLTGILLLLSCRRDKDISGQALRNFEAPEHFPPPVYGFKDNPVTDPGFVLGRALFYEPLLSVNGKVSCGSCHHQQSGFSDAGMKKSQGHDGRKGFRNTPGLSNLAWYPSFMWDGGINHIEVMPVAPITDSLEMGEELKHVFQKLANTKKYPPMFQRAFGSAEINDQSLLRALAQFMGMMVSDDSRYDRYLRGELELSEKEDKGRKLFHLKCASCHAGPLQTDFSFRNNGLDASFADPGRGRITSSKEDEGKFRVPSLRNVALTAPYMHDGRFLRLEEVLDHYSEGIVESGTLDPLLRSGITISNEEKENILAFLETLTDYRFIADGNFAEPNNE